MSYYTNNINPKSCTYGCGLQIYCIGILQLMNISEVFTKKKYIYIF